MIKRLFLLASVWCFSHILVAQHACSHRLNAASIYLNSENLKSDTFDILNYNLALNISDVNNSTIAGEALIQFNILDSTAQSIPLDLLGFTIEQVEINQQPTTFTYNDTLLRINLPAALSVADTQVAYIKYSGTPKIDNSGWGGFYFTAGYAFNMGVGFEANPHNFGRAWYPCFDNFKERATYSMHIETATNHVAASIGEFVNTTPTPNNTIIWHYEMEDPIPTYLSMVAVTNYAVINQAHQGKYNQIPIELYARASDTNNVKASFIHLTDAIQIFENGYGSYKWNKVGYSIVPFAGGAMEHATNITYPRYAVDGSLDNESLMAHELAHHWWGNLITCETPEDMWINEGWASFSSFLFFEQVYGRARGVEEVQKTLFPVLQRAHIDEGGYLAISGVPHNLTYGTHTYEKGALVAWNLRAYLGDSVFFSAIAEVMDRHAFGTINAQEFQDDLTQITGTDLSPFFNGWVFNGGYPAVELNEYTIGSNNTVSVEIEQKLRGTDQFFQEMPVELLFTNSSGDSLYDIAVVSNGITIQDFTIPFSPEKIMLNPHKKLALAHTYFKDSIESNSFLSASDVLIQSLEITDFIHSGELEIELFWVAADGVKDYNNKPFRVSQDRYWKVSKSTNSNFNVSASVLFDKSASGYYLDSALLNNFSEDSLVILYRKNPASDWELFSSATFNNFGNPNDGKGLVKLENIQNGEYCFGAIDQNALHAPAGKIENTNLKIFPNPSSGNTQFAIANSSDLLEKLVFFTLDGKEVYTAKPMSNSCTISKLPKGSYIVQVKTTTSNYSIQFLQH